MSNIRTGNLGYPRIGAQREWKRAIESFWKGSIKEEELHEQLTGIRLGHLQLQKDKGLDVIPVGDFTYYDHILDTIAMFGLIPERFDYEGGEVPLQTYYAIARGNDSAPASEMTKWFNTNYHYIVPELGQRKARLTVNRPLAAYREAKEKLGITGRPVMVGLFTFLKLSKGYEESERSKWVNELLPLYVQVLQELQEEGVEWVQIDEPALVQSLTSEELRDIKVIYETIHQEVPGVKVMLQTYFEAVSSYEDVALLPVAGIGLDLVHGLDRNLESLRAFGFPSGKLLGAGVIDGRNIWRSDLTELSELIHEVSLLASGAELMIQPSCSLMHVPVSSANELKLDPVLRNGLAFAQEKLEEVVLLANVVNHNGKDEDITRFLNENRRAITELANHPARKSEQASVAAQIGSAPSKRENEFTIRRGKQKEKWKLPLLPTTTIGSFPQTAEVRGARSKWRKGEWSTEQYNEFIQEQTLKWIRIQEEIGLDVLVHGEFERTDMVEFFGEKLPGFAFTQGGWVQSYGTRCVKPPIIYGDVYFDQPMTVSETAFAQSLTNQPVKGMLTGPVTILNWSFVRSDLPRKDVAYQLALALRKEVEALENAGIEMIQVDEPAVREGLPLRREDWENYLDWAVNAFRITTSTVKDTTQVHTHMCYCEFHDMIDHIAALDADVISIETSRSHGELIQSFEEYSYPLGIGLGVYDIHSPRIPAIDEMVSMADRALSVLDPELFWINPDCGLKTRGEQETIQSLANMVAAARQVRSKYVTQTSEVIGQQQP